jgi:hypothetical protein
MDQLPHDPDQFTADGESAAQRAAARDSLLLTAQLDVPGLARPVTARVRNLSPGGMMAEYAGDLALGDTITVELRGIGAIAAKVAWVAEGRAGIAFDREVDPKRARKPVVASPAAPRKQRPL